MKRILTLTLAALLCLGFYACGREKPVPAPDPAPVAGAVYNNGGRYVQHAGDVYYWEYWAECLEPSGIWGEFPEVPGIRRSMMRLNADGTREGLFVDNGYGDIWVLGGRFYLTWLDDDYTPQIFTAAIEKGSAMGDAKDRRALGPGEIFAVDEARGLAVASVGRVNEATYRVEYGVCAISAETGERTELPVANAQPLLYDGASAALYCRDFSAGEWNVVKLCCVDVTTGTARDVAWIDIGALEGFEDADAAECDSALVEGDTLHVLLSGYSGNAHMLVASAYLTVDMAGDAVENGLWEDLPDAMRYGAGMNEPFMWEDPDRWYICAEDGAWQLVLSAQDLAPLGLPGGPYYDEQAFGDVKDVEYVDGAVFFSILCGPRSPEEDVGWREAYGLSAMRVYRKNLATGEIEELYSFDEYSLRGG